MEENYKKFLKELGADEKILERLASEEVDVSEVANEFSQGYESAVKSRHLKSWEDEQMKKLKDNTYYRVNSVLDERFKLEGENFKQADKPFEARLEAISDKLKSKEQELEAKIQELQGDDSQKKALEQYKAQLDAANAERETLAKQIELTKSDYEQKIKQMRLGVAFEGQLGNAFSELQELLLPGIDCETIELFAKQKATFDIDDNGQLAILNKDGAPYPKSKTANYSDLSEFLMKEVVEAKGWVKKRNDGAGGLPNGDKAKIKANVHPNALNR